MLRQQQYPSPQYNTTMKVILINGSPHHHGATDIALQEIAKTLNTCGIETEIFWLGNVPIAGCIGCMACQKTGRCFREDVVNEFIEKYADADGYIFGSAVHFAGCTGALSSFMDRLFYGRTHLFRLKPAAAVVSCRRGGATAAFDEINKYFSISQMLIVGSQYWNQIHGNNAEEAKQDLEGMQTMRTLGRNMAYLLHCLEAGKQAGINLPYTEEKQKTNFIR